MDSMRHSDLAHVMQTFSRILKGATRVISADRRSLLLDVHDNLAPRATRIEAFIRLFDLLKVEL